MGSMSRRSSIKCQVVGRPFVGPRIGEGVHAKVYEGKYKNQNVAIKIVHKGETPKQIT